MNYFDVEGHVTRYRAPNSVVSPWEMNDSRRPVRLRSRVRVSLRWNAAKPAPSTSSPWRLLYFPKDSPFSGTRMDRAPNRANARDRDA